MGLLKMTLVNKLGPGNMLGELGMINRTARYATCICLEESYLSIMVKRDFEDIFRLPILKEENTKRYFLEKFILDARNTGHLTMLVGTMLRKQILPRGSRLINEGEIPDRVWFVFSGQLALKKRYLKKISNQAKLHQKDLRIPKNMTLRIEAKGSIIGEQFLFKQRGECLGLPFSIIVETEVTLYYVELSKLESLCHEKRDLKQFFEEKIILKQSIINKLLSEFQSKVAGEYQRIKTSFSVPKLEKLQNINIIMEKKRKLISPLILDSNKASVILKNREIYNNIYNPLKLKNRPAPGVIAAMTTRRAAKDGSLEAMIKGMNFARHHQGANVLRISKAQNAQARIFSDRSNAKYLHSVYSNTEIILHRVLGNLNNDSDKSVKAGSFGGTETLPSLYNKIQSSIKRSIVE